MARIDLEAPASMNRTANVWHPQRPLGLCLPAILVVSGTIFGAAQCYGQDVADAARQEHARKEAKQKKSKHVYTEEDLNRAQILTPEDREQIEAKKNRQTPPTAEKSQEPVDAESLPPDAPLGTVARRFRKQKESQKLRQSAEFHLPFADAPVLASPKPPVQPPLPYSSKPSAPRLAPYQPPVKRSPFARPNVFMAPPALVVPSHPPTVRLTPPTPVPPVAPIPSTRLDAVAVRRGDSLWKLAEQHLGQGKRWQELLSVNPGIRDANHIEAGTQIYLPAATSSFRTATKFTVRNGDTLSTIAQTQLGHASYSSCIVRVNPAIRDANLIYVGQTLLLPASCTR
jgi:LysM repeat protein